MNSACCYWRWLRQTSCLAVFQDLRPCTGGEPSQESSPQKFLVPETDDELLMCFVVEKFPKAIGRGSNVASIVRTSARLV